MQSTDEMVARHESTRRMPVIMIVADLALFYISPEMLCHRRNAVHHALSRKLDSNESYLNYSPKIASPAGFPNPG